MNMNVGTLKVVRTGLAACVAAVVCGCSTMATQFRESYGRDVRSGAELKAEDRVWDTNDCDVISNPYSGVQANLCFWKGLIAGDREATSFLYYGPGGWFVGSSCWIIDLPLSFVADTVMIPWTLGRNKKDGPLYVRKGRYQWP